MLEEIILGFVQKKTAMLQDAKTKCELQEISKPPKPIYNGNGFTPGKYDTEEEEMLVWSLTSLKAPLNSQAYYICQTYNRMGCKVCSSHKIEARDLYNLVLKDIQELAAQAMKDADMFYQRLSSGWSAGIWWTLPRLRRNGNGWKPGIRKLTGCF